MEAFKIGFIIIAAALTACATPKVAVNPRADFAGIKRVAVLSFNGPKGDLAADLMTQSLLEQALILQPVNVELHIKLGFTYTRLGKADEAQRSFETAARLDPKKAIAHYMLGLIYEKKGLKAKAIASWQSCLDTAADPHMRETAIKHLNTLR